MQFTNIFWTGCIRTLGESLWEIEIYNPQTLEPVRNWNWGVKIDRNKNKINWDKLFSWFVLLNHKGFSMSLLTTYSCTSNTGYWWSKQTTSISNISKICTNLLSVQIHLNKQSQSVGQNFCTIFLDRFLYLTESVSVVWDGQFLIVRLEMIFSIWSGPNCPDIIWLSESFQNLTNQINHHKIQSWKWCLWFLYRLSWML